MADTFSNRQCIELSQDHPSQDQDKMVEQEQSIPNDARQLSLNTTARRTVSLRGQLEATTAIRTLQSAADVAVLTLSFAVWAVTLAYWVSICLGAFVLAAAKHLIRHITAASSQGASSVGLDIPFKACVPRLPSSSKAPQQDRCDYSNGKEEYSVDDVQPACKTNDQCHHVSSGGCDIQAFYPANMQKVLAHASSKLLLKVGVQNHTLPGALQEHVPGASSFPSSTLPTMATTAIVSPQLTGMSTSISSNGSTCFTTSPTPTPAPSVAFNDVLTSSNEDHECQPPLNDLPHVPNNEQLGSNRPSVDGRISGSSSIADGIDRLINIMTTPPVLIPAEIYLEAALVNHNTLMGECNGAAAPVEATLHQPSLAHNHVGARVPADSLASSPVGSSDMNPPTNPAYETILVPGQDSSLVQQSKQLAHGQQESMMSQMPSPIKETAPGAHITCALQTQQTSTQAVAPTSTRGRVKQQVSAIEGRLSSQAVASNKTARGMNDVKVASVVPAVTASQTHMTAQHACQLSSAVDDQGNQLLQFWQQLQQLQCKLAMEQDAHAATRVQLEESTRLAFELPTLRKKVAELSDCLFRKHGDWLTTRGQLGISQAECARLQHMFKQTSVKWISEIETLQQMVTDSAAEQQQVYSELQKTKKKLASEKQVVAGLRSLVKGDTRSSGQQAANCSADQLLKMQQELESVQQEMTSVTAALADENTTLAATIKAQQAEIAGLTADKKLLQLKLESLQAIMEGCNKKADHEAPVVPGIELPSKSDGMSDSDLDSNNSSAEEQLTSRAVLVVPRFCLPLKSDVQPDGTPPHQRYSREAQSFATKEFPVTTSIPTTRRGDVHSDGAPLQGLPGRDAAVPRLRLPANVDLQTNSPPLLPRFQAQKQPVAGKEAPVLPHFKLPYVSDDHYSDSDSDQYSSSSSSTKKEHMPIHTLPVVPRLQLLVMNAQSSNVPAVPQFQLPLQQHTAGTPNQQQCRRDAQAAASYTFDVAPPMPLPMNRDAQPRVVAKYCGKMSFAKFMAL